MHLRLFKLMEANLDLLILYWNLLGVLSYINELGDFCSKIVLGSLLAHLTIKKLAVLLVVEEQGHFIGEKLPESLLENL